LAKRASAKPKAFRRSRVWIASLIALSLASLAATFVGGPEMGRTLELLVSDILRTAHRLPDEPQTARVTTIEIDDASIGHPYGGRWIWPRLRQAEFIDALASLGPRLIVLDIEYLEPEQACVDYHIAADGGRQAYALDKPDDILRASLVRAGNVLVPFILYIAGRPESGGGALADRKAEVPPVLERFAFDVPPEVAGPLCTAEALKAMIPEVGDAAVGSGYTSLLKDTDGAVRRVPLVARAGDRVLPHMGLAMAGHWQFGPGFRVELKPNRLVLRSADGLRSVGVPVDKRAQLSLRWPRSLAAMDRISAGPILDLAYARHNLAALRERWAAVMAELDRLFPAEGWAEARRRCDEALAQAKAAPDDAALRAAAAARQEDLARVEERLAMALAEYGEGRTPPPAGQAGARLRKAAETGWPFIAAYEETESRFSADAAAAEARVRPRIQGNLCIIGLNATAGIDQHKTPISRNQPGVTVYPAVMRTILSGIAFRHLPARLEWVMAVLAAWLVGILASRLPTAWGIVAAVWMSAAILAAGWVASAQAAMLLPVAGPILAVGVAFAGVSGYRQLTEASSRRWISRVFEQYTSPELLSEILRNPESLRLGGERRDITVIFSDVAGFTPLSESMEAEKLVALLNHYLGAMTDILKAERATLDKYEGDGILAFIGAPIQIPDHPRRAVRAAIAMQDAMPKVNEDLAQKGLLPEGARLRIRVGCSSGPASVGNFGSEKRIDYTAMGDTVNLGGRLEEANRWLNTRILVPEPTRQACGDTILFRRLGLARIRGKAQPMPLYEPLALEPAPAKLKAVAEAFGRAIDALEAGNVDAAEAALADLLAADPEDGPAQVLKKRLEAIRAGELAPTEPWNLARPK